MQKWNQSITEQWKNLERVMEERGNGRKKTKGDGLEFRGGVYDGGKIGGTRGVAWAGSLGRGQAMWSEALLGSCWKQRSPQVEGCKVWECRVSSVKFQV